ncbi:PIGF/3-ketodihydrosphingosine reductase fusion protein-like [Syzygium oleosum]|uniref:PIGF/3-ketodihydrosphingosine reductase fusion protein-like n=1 Tax=Syzygium oleosum TaxID=219896 RepID=UPI0024BAD143|nr:PIGF/3-ketodihydrosphingosine reductase fusion protein-like [Syzygium oleosum]
MLQMLARLFFSNDESDESDEPPSSSTEETKRKKRRPPPKASGEASVTGELATLHALSLHLACGLSLAAAAPLLWIATRGVESANLVSDPSRALRLVWVIECPIAILLYGLVRERPAQTSYVRAVLRGALALPAGALVNALGAIALGAPVGIQYLVKTVNWSLVMSTLTFVPAACVFGASWNSWQRIFAFTKPISSVDFMICLPAHGAIIGAWFGAWPMPLDWERPWQEWPICVSYGAIIGYLVGMVASLGFILLRRGHHHVKVD